MKKGTRRFMAILLAALFVVSAGLSAPVSVQAAAKLKKSDFKKSYGTYQTDFVERYSGYPCALLSVTPLKNGTAEKNNFMTARKIYIGSKKSAVLKKYGKAKVYKFNAKKDNIYWVINKTGASTLKSYLKKSKKYVQYTYGSYMLRFYFNKSNKVNYFAYTKNYNKFRKAKWTTY